MADSKITALTALTAADPANDMIPIVDVSDTPPASGNTKRISINNLLACSPSATLASATITGALGAAGLNVTGATIPANGVYLGSANNLSFSAASALAMTLNATGLGVGVASPAVKGHFYSASGSNELRLETAATGAGSTNRLSFKSASGAADARTGAIEWYDVATFKGDIRLLKAGGIQIRNSADSPTFNLDDTGNCGIGVTPVSKLTVSGGVSLTSAASNHFLRDGTAWIWSSDGASTGTARGGLYADGSSNLNLYGGSTLASHLQINSSGDVISKVNTSVPTVANSQMVFNLTTNTNLRITVRGTDGTLRSANITLAP